VRVEGGWREQGRCREGAGRVDGGWREGGGRVELQLLGQLVFVASPDCMSVFCSLLSLFVRSSQ